MVRRFVQLHTLVLACCFALLALAPDTFLGGLGVTDVSYATLSLTRVVSALLVVVAGAVLSVPSLVGAARTRALLTIGLAYVAGAFLLLTQQIAIWNTTAGAILTAIPCLFAIGFIGLWFAERKPVVATA